MNVGQAARKQLGTDKEKIRRDSPRLHASEVQIPILMIHGDRDAQADVEQSQSMDAALTRWATARNSRSRAASAIPDGRGYAARALAVGS